MWSILQPAHFAVTLLFATAGGGVRASVWPNWSATLQRTLDHMLWIRAKEATKAKHTITRDPVKERQLEMLSQLPDFVRIVRGFFVTEKKAALLREDVVKKLVDRHPSRLPPDKVESHLQYLLEVLPGWIKSVKVTKGVFIKVDKKADLKTIMEKLERTKNDLAKQK